MLVTVSLPDSWPSEPEFEAAVRAAIAETFPIADIHFERNPGAEVMATLAAPGHDAEDKAWDEGVIVDLVVLAYEAWQNRPQPLTLALPPEFTELCAACKVAPELVLRGFIADLCDLFSYASNPRPDGYSSNGSDERQLAKQYFRRCGYAVMAGLEDEGSNR